MSSLSQTALLLWKGRCRHGRSQRIGMGQEDDCGPLIAKTPRRTGVIARRRVASRSDSRIELKNPVFALFISRRHGVDAELTRWTLALLAMISSFICPPLSGGEADATVIRPSVMRVGDRLSIVLHRKDTGIAVLKDLGEVGEITIGLGVTDQNGLNLAPNPSLVTDSQLASLEGLKALRVLIAIESDVSDQGLAHLSGLVALKELWLDFNPKVTDAGLAHLHALQNLRVLRFHRSPITDAGIVGIKEFKELEDLQLGYARITDASLGLIAGFAKLKILDLQHTEVTDNGMSSLSGLVNLTWLCLDNTKVGDEGLAHLEGLTNLTWLILNETKVTDKGLAHLRRMGKLETLYLTSTSVTDEGLLQLAEVKSLRRLSLKHTKTTAKGHAALKKALPKLEIILSDAQG